MQVRYQPTTCPALTGQGLPGNFLQPRLYPPLLAARSISCLPPVSGPTAVLLGQIQQTSLECTLQPATATTVLTIPRLSTRLSVQPDCAAPDCVYNAVPGGETQYQLSQMQTSTQWSAGWKYVKHVHECISFADPG